MNLIGTYWKTKSPDGSGGFNYFAQVLSREWSDYQKDWFYQAKIVNYVQEPAIFQAGFMESNITEDGWEPCTKDEFKRNAIKLRLNEEK